MVIPIVFPDEIEVQIFSTTSGATLVAAIELVSPGNKDRAEARRAFAAKCVSYLTNGIGLIDVDIVTNRLQNLHEEILGMLGHAQANPSAERTYCGTAYHPVRTPSADQLELWYRPLPIGAELPILPLGLRNGGVVPVDFDETYTEACSRSRLD